MSLETLFIIFLVYAILIIRFYKNLLANLSYLDKDYSKLPELYRPFARLDKNNWNHLEIYFGAVFLLPIRLTGIIFLTLSTLLVLKIGSIGVPLHQEWPKQRFIYVRKTVNSLSSWYMFFSGFWYIKTIPVEYSDFDPEYKQTPEDRVREPAIIVSNHVSWYDTIFHVSRFMPSFLSKTQVANYPVFGPITTALKTVYVNREDRTTKDTVLEQIRVRSRQISEGKSFPPVIIFPEGTTTSGQQLISFKKGAFEGLLPIKIVCLKYHDRRFSLALDKVGILAVAALSLVQLANKLDVYEFQGLYNPKHLQLEKYPEEERWVIYAERVKDIMAKCLKVEKSEAGFRHNQEFERTWFPDIYKKVKKE